MMILPESPPSTPQLLSPIDNAVNQPLSVELTWSATDPDTADVLKYSLTIKNNLDTNVIQVNDLKVNLIPFKSEVWVSYFWQVSVSDGIHQPVLSQTGKFTTNTVPANRYHYVKKLNGNFVIISSDEQGITFSSQIPLTTAGGHGKTIMRVSLLFSELKVEAPISTPQIQTVPILLR
jgi:hypothetical protein